MFILTQPFLGQIPSRCTENVMLVLLQLPGSAPATPLTRSIPVSLFTLLSPSILSLLYPSSPTAPSQMLKCSKQPGNPRATETPFHSFVQLGKKYMPRAAAEGPVIPCQEVNPHPIKRLGIIRHFLFVRHFIAIFISSFY